MFRPIGIFDSGVGGISVLRDAVRLLPNEHFIFYGDNFNAPYGIKPREEIQACVSRVVDQLMQRDIKALVIACNTATAASAAYLRQTLEIPIIGMEPALKPAHALRKGGQILVLATPATLHMEKFMRLMSLYGEGAVPVEGRGIVECVEAGHLDDERIHTVLHGLLDEHLRRKTDAIVLGCTHYLFIRRALQAIAPGIPLVDGNEGTVRQLGHVLEQSGLLNLCGPGGYELHTSGDERTVLPLMERLMRVPTEL